MCICSPMSLAIYKKRRDFKKTPEPIKGKKSLGKKSVFVIQKHHARHLHYDFRLEMDGILKSWAVPKGPPKKLQEKHLAILTEDHPLDYAHFEGMIPKGHYGAGKVEIWDKGTFTPLKKEIPLKKAFKSGLIEVHLEGIRLKGNYALIHFKENNWLFIKMKKKKNP